MAGAGALTYASVVERNLFTLRQAEVPVLAPGTTVALSVVDGSVSRVVDVTLSGSP